MCMIKLTIVTIKFDLWSKSFMEYRIGFSAIKHAAKLMILLKLN